MTPFNNKTGRIRTKRKAFCSVNPDSCFFSFVTQVPDFSSAPLDESAGHTPDRARAPAPAPQRGPRASETLVDFSN